MTIINFNNYWCQDNRISRKLQPDKNINLLIQYAKTHTMLFLKFMAKKQKDYIYKKLNRS